MSIPTDPTFVRIPLDELLGLLVQRVVALLDSERCTIFLHDTKNKELFSRVASGAEVKEIRIPQGAGLAGECFTTGKLINIPDAYADARFNPQVDLATGYRTRTILCFPIVGPRGEKVGLMQVLNRIGGGFTGADQRLIEVFAAQTAITLQNALAEDALEVARAKERELAERLAENHHKLQAAFGDLAAQKETLETLMRQQRMMRRMAAGAGVLVALIVLAVVFGRRRAGEGAVREAVVSGDAVAAMKPIEAAINVAGVLEPITTSSLPSPFAGKIRTISVQPGDRVTTGQALVELDTAQLDSELRDLESRVIEARRIEQELATWSNGRDVANARRNVSRNRSDLEQARVQSANTGKLFERGVVSEIERNTANAFVANLGAQLASAEEDLAATLKRGDEGSLRVARNSLENIETELKRKRTNRDRAKLIAPHDGVILRGATGNEIPLTPGRDAFEGEVLLRVGRVEGFSVRSTVDEADVLLVRPGQPVRVTGAAFYGIELQGTVSVVNSQAANNGTGVSRFEIAAAMPVIPEEARAKLFLGMTTDVRVQVYSNDNALVIPFGAIQGTAGAYTATVRLADGKTEPRTLRTGVTSAGEVEVLDGLKAGERIVLYR